MTQPLAFGPADSDPQLWDRIVLGGVEFPGIATVEIDRSNKKDEKKSKGKHGSENEYSGAENAKVKITIRFWTAEQYDAVVTDCLKVVEPDPTKKKVDSVTIGHPIASARRVTAIMVDKVSGPTRRDKVWELSIDATEAKAPEAKGATGKYSGKGGGPPKGDCAALQQQYREHQAEATKLRAQAEEAFLQSQRPAPKTETFIGGVDLNNGVNPESEAQRQRARSLQAQAAGHDNEARNIYARMQAMGCAERLPSGTVNTTQP